jgi:lysophospholipase L1-like esterase
MSLQISYKRQTILMIMLLVVFFVALEITLKVYDNFNPRCDFMSNPLSENVTYENKKNVCTAWRNHLIYIDPVTDISQSVPNQHFITMNINNEGFRGPEILKDKPEDTYRIFVVGGSTTFSIRVLSDQDTIPGHLQRNLDELKLDKKIEVINGGIDAQTSNDELQLITKKIVDYDPDLIIVYDGFNDIVNVPGKTKNRANDDLFTKTWKQYLTFYDTPFIIGGIIESIKNPVNSLVLNTEWEEKTRIWKQNMISICELGNTKGFDTMIVLQPFLGTGNKKLSEFETQTYENWWQDRLSKGYQLFAEQLDDLANYCTITADFRNAYDNVNGSVYFDFAHVGSESNSIVAKKIDELVLPLID